MNDELFRFPQIPHIASLGEGSPRDDKLMSSGEARSLLSGSVIVEEKLDGANLGFSVGPTGASRAQNRGHYLVEPYIGQFTRLSGWMSQHGAGLATELGEHLIAFGEWCAARHSLDYTALPDWWLLFDVYDRRTRKFWSTQRRDLLARKLHLATVPRVAVGHQSIESLKNIVAHEHSRYRDGRLEGVVVRSENSDWLVARAKLVRTDFAQAITEHWRSRRLQWNHVNWPAGGLGALFGEAK